MNWQNQSNINFLGICFSAGLLTSNVARTHPIYFWLCMVFLICIVLFLFLYGSPEANFEWLWRLGGLAVIIGALVTYWELLAGFSPMQIIGAIVAGVILGILGIFVVGIVTQGGRK